MITEIDLENLVVSLHRNLVDELRKEAERCGFTPSQFEVMRCVAENGSPTMKEISDVLRITPPSVTSTVETLCGHGFLKREVDENDRRIVRVVVTPKAIKSFSDHKNTRLAIFKKQLMKLNENDKKDLIRILNIIISE